MKMEQFADKLYKEIVKELGREVRAEVREVRKNNGVILHGLLVRKQGQDVAATIYLDTFLEAYESGMAFRPIVRKVLDICREEWDREPVDMGFFQSFGQVRDRICYRLVRRKGNEGMLEGIPYIGFLDLAICFYYAYHGEMGDGTIQINNSHMEMWGTCTEELFGLSERNTPRLFPWECCGLQETLEEMAGMGGDAADSGGAAEALCEEDLMKVLSNTGKIHGAACILYPGVLEEIAGKTGHDLFILPSSVHEVILLPDTGRESSEALRQMVQEVNSTQVAPEEVLSDTLYRYDRARGRVMTA